MKSTGGFTLIELLIVIAIVLITVAGEFRAIRHQTRSVLNAHDTEMVSAALAGQLAELRLIGLDRCEGSAPLPIDPIRQCEILKDATGAIELAFRGEIGMVEARAHLMWRSPAGERRMEMATYLRPPGGCQP